MAAGGYSDLNGTEMGKMLQEGDSSRLGLPQSELELIAVLERVDEDRMPLIVSTARTRCLWCNHWCWLGDKSVNLILSGEAVPMCSECAMDLAPGNAIPVGPIQDTLWDGRQ